MQACPLNRLFIIRPLRLIVLFLCTGVSLQFYAQDESRMKPFLDASDIKKIDKAEGYRIKADKLTEEANQLYQEVFSVQDDPEIDERKAAKIIAKLESDAQKKQEKASSLYEKCNEIKFIVYQRYLDRFWSSFEGDDEEYNNERLIEEQADEYYFQAVNFRIDAASMPRSTAKIETLTQANELESMAIQKQLTALGTYYGFEIEDIQPETTTEIQELPEYELQDSIPARSITQKSIPPETTLPEGMLLDQEMIDMYNRYIESGQFFDSTLLISEMTGVTSFDRDRILELWYEYIYGDDERLAFFDRRAVDSVEIQPTAEELMQQEAITEPAERELGVVTEENLATIVPADEEVIYRVQISASRTSLSQRALSNIYYGNKKVDMIVEDGWYKYSVGDFNTFKEADDFRRSSGVSNAFIVAYRKGTRFLPVTEEGPPIMADVTAMEEHAGMPAGLLFRIQIAANRVSFSVGQLNSIYRGNYPIEVVREEGWYKYQFLGVRLYADAIRLISNVTADGAFIVAYRDGIKQNLYESVIESRELEKTIQTYGRKGYLDEIEFHVQLAATRLPARPEEIQRLYAGSELVSVILEDNWYKYHIKTGNSYERAVKIKQECGIDKAFIVAYRRAEKITLSEALQELK